LPDDGGTCNCGRIRRGIDTKPEKIVRLKVAPKSAEPASKQANFGNRCTEDGHHFDEGGFCSHEHEAPA